MSLGFVLTVTAALQLYLLRRLRFDWLTVAIVLGGTALYTSYASYTSIAERNYDGPSHLEYIQSLALQRRLPDVYGCGPCGHPPAYYALGALWSALWAPAAWLPPELALQWLSLLLFGAFITFALLVLRSSGLGPAGLRLGAALVVFWPSSVINSVRVHNDALASPLMLGAIYFMAEWDRRGRARHFAVALGLCALALFTKSSAYPVAVMLMGLALVRALSKPRRRRGLELLAISIVVLTAAATTAVAFRESRAPTTLCQKVLGLACDGRYVPPVPDSLSRFIDFDVAAFFRSLSADGELPERDLFLNRVAKSSLLGVMPLGDELSGAWHHGFAKLMGAQLLLMLAVCAAGLPFIRRSAAKGARVYLGAPFVLLAFLVAFRVRAPNEFHEDFRHIFAALVPFCVAYVSVVERAFRRSRWLGLGGVAIGLGMAASSVAFFAPLARVASASITATWLASAPAGHER